MWSEWGGEWNGWGGGQWNGGEGGGGGQWNGCDHGCEGGGEVKEEEEEEEEEEDGMADGQEEGGGLTVGEGIGQVHNGSISNSLINPRLPEPPELPQLHPMGRPIYQEGTFAPSTPAGRPGQEEPDSDVNMAPTNEAAFPDSPVPATWFCMSVKWMKLVLI